MKKLILIGMILISNYAHVTTFNITCPNKVKNVQVYGTQVNDWTLNQSTIPSLSFVSSAVFPAGQFQFVYCYYNDGFAPPNKKLGTVYKAVKAQTCTQSLDPKIYNCTK